MRGAFTISLLQEKLIAFYCGEHLIGRCSIVRIATKKLLRQKVIKAVISSCLTKNFVKRIRYIGVLYGGVGIGLIGKL